MSKCRKLELPNHIFFFVCYSLILFHTKPLSSYSLLFTASGYLLMECFFVEVLIGLTDSSISEPLKRFKKRKQGGGSSFFFVVSFFLGNIN